MSAIRPDSRIRANSCSSLGQRARSDAPTMARIGPAACLRPIGTNVGHLRAPATDPSNSRNACGLLHRESRLEQHSAVNLKFLSFKPQARVGTSNSKPHWNHEVAVPLDSEVRIRVPQARANFGSGTSLLRNRRRGEPCSPLHVGCAPRIMKYDRRCR